MNNNIIQKPCKSGSKSKPKAYKPNSKQSTGAMMIKEEKEVSDATTQYTPRPAEKKIKTKDAGISVALERHEKPKELPKTVNVAIETDLKMTSKELNSELTSLQSTGKKKQNKNRKNSKANVTDFEDEIMMNNYELSKSLNRGKRQKSNDKPKTKQKGSSYDSLKQRTKYGTNTPECYVNALEEKRNAKTIQNDDSPRSKRRVRRSMDHYQHPDFDNYLLYQTHYYHSLNAFPKGSKFQKDMAMRGMLFKKNNFKESLIASSGQNSMMARYKAQASSDKCVKEKKKRNNSTEIEMLYQPSAKKGYPHLKPSLTKSKTPSVPESSQQSGRRKRSNSQ